MLPWHGTRIFKHCAKRVSCLQHCLEFILYFLCKRALTLMSIPHLGSHLGTWREKGVPLPALGAVPSSPTSLLGYFSTEAEKSNSSDYSKPCRGFKVPLLFHRTRKEGDACENLVEGPARKEHGDGRHESRRTGLRF